MFSIQVAALKVSVVKISGDGSYQNHAKPFVPLFTNDLIRISVDDTHRCIFGLYFTPMIQFQL